MLPNSGLLRTADEYLAALRKDGKLDKRRKAFIERQGEYMCLRQEGQAHPRHYEWYERHRDGAILALPHYAHDHPLLAAVRLELKSWRFFYFEPRERMRAATSAKEVRHVGAMGEDLAAFLITLKTHQPRQFDAMEKALKSLLPDVDGIETEVNDFGEAEFRLRENGVAISARVLSEGTLRLLGLLALTSAQDAPSLVGFEEPENGVHPRRLELIAELLKVNSQFRETQFIVTTHSPILPDRLPKESLFVVQRSNRDTQIAPFENWGPLGRKRDVEDALDDGYETLPISERILRGDFDA